MDFGGWVLFKDLVIVCKGEEYKPDMQAFIADGSNKKQLVTARKWAATNSFADGSRVVVPGVEFCISNSGIKMELFDVAEGSCNGGKLSFWNCRIITDGKSFIVGINSSLLLQLLLQSKSINGKIEEDLVFARCNGNLGLLHSGMSQYAIANKDMAVKADFKKNKVSKHKLGYNYYSPTKDNVFLGYLYYWLKPLSIEDSPGATTKYNVNYELLEKPIKKAIFIQTYKLKDMKGQTCKDFFMACIKGLENDGRDMHKGSYFSFDYDIVEKLPSRLEGEMILDCSDSLPTISSYIHLHREYELKKLAGRRTLFTSDVKIFGYTFSEDTKPVIPANFRYCVVDNNK